MMKVRLSARMKLRGIIITDVIRRKKADGIQAPVWKLKKGDTFSDWRVCRDWLQGTFPPGEIKFQEGRPHEQTYHAYLEEAATYTSTTHRIACEWRSMHKEWAAFEASKKKAAEDEARAALLRAKLEADRAKFESDQKTEEWSIAGWKRKAEAEAALLSEECKRWREICEKDNNEKMGLRNVINNLKAEVERLNKQDTEIEKLKQEKADTEATRDEARSHRERSEQRETARVTAESQIEALKNDMLWLKDRGIISVANSVLNSDELDETVAYLLVAARNDGYAQGYSECSQQVVNALKLIGIPVGLPHMVLILKLLLPLQRLNSTPCSFL
ncbi:hypothetical protein HanIR_Chr01g0029721 [Helianthus annuus]|nr:hypothetical protein HanIR_Chr01g0029721 [Helianthus annuus]